MTARERVLALRLLEKQGNNPDFARKIGVQVTLHKQKKAKHGGEMNV